MAERIANSRATIETDNTPHSSRFSGDTNSTFHHRRKSGEEVKTEEIHFQYWGDELKGVFKSFKDEDGSTENKQLPLASNAITNDTDFTPGNNSGIKKILENKKFEEIKEEDENNESYDARKHIENLEDVNYPPDFDLSKKPTQQINAELKNAKWKAKNEFDFSNHDDILKNQETREDEQEEDNEVNMLFVERKFWTMCSIEQPLRTKHCRKCKKWVASYDHHCPWVGNWIGEK